MNAEDIEFLAAFEECRLDKGCWSHSAHIRMAWLQMEKLGYQRALDRIRETIHRYNSSTGSTGYHETVTIAFARLIHYRRLTDARYPSWRQFLDANGDLLSKEKPALERYYSRELLFSERAFREMVEPDVRPLPAAGKLRAATAADALGVLAIYGPCVRETPISFETETPSEAEIAKRISDTAKVAPWLVYEVDGALAGYAYGGQHRARAAYRWTAEVSVYVHPAFHRRGIARLLYANLLRRLTAQNYSVALAGVTLPNTSSVATHEALGFEPIGVFSGIGFKFGRWHDVGWWQKRLRPAEPSPAEPLPPSSDPDPLF